MVLSASKPLERLKCIDQRETDRGRLLPSFQRRLRSSCVDTYFELISSWFAVMPAMGCGITTAASHPELVDCHDDHRSCTGMVAGTEATTCCFLASKSIELDA